MIHVHCTSKHRNNNDRRHRNDYNDHNYNETTKTTKYRCLPAKLIFKNSLLYKNSSLHEWKNHKAECFVAYIHTMHH